MTCQHRSKEETVEVVEGPHSYKRVQLRQLCLRESISNWLDKDLVKYHGIDGCSAWCYKCMDGMAWVDLRVRGGIDHFTVLRILKNIHTISSVKTYHIRDQHKKVVELQNC